MQSQQAVCLASHLLMIEQEHPGDILGDPAYGFGDPDYILGTLPNMIFSV